MNTKLKLLMRATLVTSFIVFSRSASANGFAWFQRPTDTIEALGQTVLNTNCTFEAVVMLPSGGNTGGNIFNEWADNQEDKRLRIGTNFLVATTFPPVGNFLAPTTVITLDAWHHVAFVYDGIEQRMYLDGVLLASRLTSSPIGNSNGAGYVGAIFRDGGVFPSFQGYLDSLRISRVARYTGVSFAPILSDFNSDADTVLLYNFNDQPGSTAVTDESPLGRNGVLGIGFTGATSPTLVRNSSGISLSIAQTATNFIVSWPSVATNQMLQFAPSLAPPVLWMSVTNQPAVQGGRLTVPVSASISNGFFRLEQQ